MKVPDTINLNKVIPHSSGDGTTKAQKEEHDDDPLDVQGGLQLEEATLAYGLGNTAHDLCIMTSIKYYDDDDDDDDDDNDGSSSGSGSGSGGDDNDDDDT